MKMIVSWNESATVKVGANFEKVGARELSFQKRCVRQLVQFLREQGDDDDNDDGDDDVDDDDVDDDVDDDDVDDDVDDADDDVDEVDDADDDNGAGVMTTAAAS